MIDARNPFHVRKVETINADETFLNLFQSTTLGALSSEKIWNRLHVFRSSQGGGKSSLLRLFTPGPLWSLWKEHSSRKRIKEWGDLYTALEGFNVFGIHGPEVLGVIVPCTRPYESLEHLDGSPHSRLSLLNALFDARILSESIKAALKLRGLRYPDHLDRLSMTRPILNEEMGSVPQSTDPKDIINWARETENKIWRIIDEGSEVPGSSLGHTEVYSLSLFQADCFVIDGSPVARQGLIMFDDAHLLSPIQRQYLWGKTATSRSASAMWIAERLQALDAYKVLSIGSSTEREIVEENLANQWRTASQRKPKVFEIIGSRRMAESATGVGASFDALVNAPIEQAEWLDKLSTAYDQLQARVLPRLRNQELFSDLRDLNLESAGGRFEAALKLKETEIVIERNVSKNQPSLDMPEGVDLPSQEETAKLRAAAEYQLCIEFGIPYYHGLDKIAQLASANVDQFLLIGGHIFDQVLAMRTKNRRPPVSARRQELIILRAAKELWDEIPTRMPEGDSVQRFLAAVGSYCRDVSRSPKASYDRGLTGFAITRDAHQSIADPTKWSVAENKLVAEILALCVAHNLLIMDTDARQGPRDRVITKFYLNRLICAHMKLPLGYGGFHVKEVSTLAAWARTGHPQKVANPSLQI